MEQAKKGTGLSPEQVERVKAAQKRHTVIDPGCENLAPEEFISWHPVGGISWEERAQRMKAAGITAAAKIPTLAVSRESLKNATGIFLV